MRPLPGLRDFYPEDCARRGYVLDGWRRVARRYGFVEMDDSVIAKERAYRKPQEWPQVKGKILATRAEAILPQDTLAGWLKTAHS